MRSTSRVMKLNILMWGCGGVGWGGQMQPFMCFRAGMRLDGHWSFLNSRKSDFLFVCFHTRCGRAATRRIKQSNLIKFSAPFLVSFFSFFFFFLQRCHMKITPADNLLASSTPNYTQLASEFKRMRPNAHKQRSHDVALTAASPNAGTRLLEIG